MAEMKAIINARVDPDMNVSMQFTRVVDTEEEAREAGRLDNTLFMAYMGGYGEAAAAWLREHK